MIKPKTVPQMLSDLGALNRQRGEVYGKDYHHVGEVLKGMFPDGIHIDSPDAMNRLSMLLMMTTKLMRYAGNINKGGHEDSLCDVAVYSQMLREWDLMK